MDELPKLKISKPHPRELFVAGLTPFELFSLHLSQLRDIVEQNDDLKDDGYVLSNAAAEVCLIGLVSFFEAFCKHHFAAIVNICPSLLEQLSEKRDQASVRLKDISLLLKNLEDQIGFVVAEQFDFGSAKAINGVFSDLVRVSPFSKGEASKYDQLLNDRNLLVHHAGIYTMRYARQKLSKNELPDNLFQNSITIAKSTYFKWEKFLDGMVIKLTRATTDALRKYAQKGSTISPERMLAIEYLLMDIDMSTARIVEMGKAFHWG